MSYHLAIRSVVSVYSRSRSPKGYSRAYSFIDSLAYSPAPSTPQYQSLPLVSSFPALPDSPIPIAISRFRRQIQFLPASATHNTRDTYAIPPASHQSSTHHAPRIIAWHFRARDASLAFHARCLVVLCPMSHVSACSALDDLLPSFRRVPSFVGFAHSFLSTFYAFLCSTPFHLSCFPSASASASHPLHPVRFWNTPTSPLDPFSGARCTG